MSVRRRAMARTAAFFFPHADASSVVAVVHFTHYSDTTLQTRNSVAMSELGRTESESTFQVVVEQ